MAFMAVMNFISGKPPVAPPMDTYKVPMTSALAVTEGKVYKISRIGSGNYRAALATAQDGDAAFIAINSADGVADSNSTPQVFARPAWILPGTVYKAPLTDKDGSDITTLHADVRVGARLGINDTGDGVDGETDYNAKDGPLSVVKVDRDNEEVWVVFNTSYTNMNLATIST